MVVVYGSADTVKNADEANPQLDVSANDQPQRGKSIDRSSWQTPWVQLRYFSYHPCIYPSLIGGVSPNAKAGQWVCVYDREGQFFGQGLYHPKARVPLRMFHHDPESRDEAWFQVLIDRAIDLRLQHLKLADKTDAFRVIHSDGDGLSGLVVDRYADVLSIEVHSLGIFQRLSAWLPHMHERLQTRQAVVDVDPNVARIEGIRGAERLSDKVKTVRIREHGIRYEVNLLEGHKTGFFCDQRDNRLRLSQCVKDLRVLDLCCYTGGFSLAAKVLGGAAEATGVDLDEKAIAQAKRNANLNQARINWIHVDAFSYARQMQKNQERWDVVVLDPPKLMLSRDEEAIGRRKYEDLNQLAMSLVKPGGLMVTCSCSGLLSPDEFEKVAIRAAHRQQRRLQFLDRTGAGPDHPVMSNCPESRYLKVLWARVF
jgi:23S rRNA (cytosine1962-C5)-methyltransferase